MTAQLVCVTSETTVLEQILAWSTFRQSLLETLGCCTDGLIVIRRGDMLEIPGWQLIKDENGRLIANPLVLEINYLLMEFRPDSEQLGTWWLTPHALLGGKTPISVIGDVSDELLMQIARSSASTDRAKHNIRPGMTVEEMLTPF